LNEIHINDDERPIDVLYVGDLSDKIVAFEDNYVWIKKYWPNLNVCYNSSNLIPSKKKEYNSIGITETTESWDKAKFTIIIGSEDDYATGHLSKNMFNAIRCGCIPYLADEHRFFKTFNYIKRDSSVIFSFDYNYYIGYIAEFYNTLIKYHPEMIAKNLAKHIDNLFKMW
jgi:hypothetical protein